MSRVSVVHLVRKCNGPEPLERFMAAYHATTPPSSWHELVLACKGFDEGDVQAHGNARVILLPDTGFDLGSYRRAALQLESKLVVFVNSWSRPIVRGWLDRLIEAANQEHIGLVGCTGSLEVDPHIRTNAFAMSRELFIGIVHREPETREEACALEAGPDSITRAVQTEGLQAWVIGGLSDFHYSVGAEVGHARETMTYRWGNQRNLLIADNRTDDYQNASPERRKELQMLAWGCTE